MTKKERENIDHIVGELKNDVEYIEGYNVSVSRLARLYEKSNDLSKEQSETFEAVCKQIEETKNDISKTISFLSCFGSVDTEH